MTFRLPKLSLILAAFACLASSLSAQEGGDVQAELEARRSKLAQKRQAQIDSEVGESKPMTEEERLEARKRRGSRGQCRFVASMRPPKLLPGQSGTLLITAVLQGRSVMPAPSQVSMKPQVSKTVQVGSLLARPAQVGTIHEAYRGRPVYENTAVFEVPVTITQEAKLGDKVRVGVELEFDIYDGRTAQAVGRFIENVQTEVEVAPHLDPQVEGRAMRESKAAEAQPVEPLSGSGGGDVATGGGGDKAEAMGGSANAAVAPEPQDPVEPASENVDDDLPITATDEGGFPTMLIIGGGAFLLVIVLLLMRKK